jgi:predicted hydrocarbon binding protein
MASPESHRNTLPPAWSGPGDLAVGRPNLGPDVPVILYRLLEFSLRNALTARYGAAEATAALRAGDHVAGERFCRNVLGCDLRLDEFVAQLQKALRELKIGVLRVERADPSTLEMVITIAEDLECSGLLVSGDTVCEYDEGFIASILADYSGREFEVREIDCWATGGRVRRFAVSRLSPPD